MTGNQRRIRSLGINEQEEETAAKVMVMVAMPLPFIPN